MSASDCRLTGWGRPEARRALAGLPEPPAVMSGTKRKIERPTARTSSSGWRRTPFTGTWTS